jgi:ATP-dependent Clp protease ATP-binding subunit ClpC
LLRALPERAWQATLHIDGDARRAGDPEWPDDRRWGPPRTAEEFLLRLEDEKRSFRNTLLLCTGEYAGAFLAMESGMHRFVGLRGLGQGERAHLQLRTLGMSAVLGKNDWIHPALSPLGPAGDEDLKRAKPVRTHADDEVWVLQAAEGLQIKHEAYWTELERVLFDHLMHYEGDDAPERDPLFVGPLDLVRRG